MEVGRAVVVHQFEEAIDFLRRAHAFALARNSGLTTASKSSFFCAAMYGVALDQLAQRLVEQLHPLRAADLHGRVDLVRLLVADHVGDVGVAAEDLERGDLLARLFRRQQALRDHVLHRLG